jgi:RNA polymerase sigma-70 factor (ECF subfamily)
MDPNRWVEQHGDALFAYARLRLQDPVAAEDVVQEALVAALEAHENFDNRSSERTWLIGILRHKVLDHLRRSGRERPVGDMSLDEPPDPSVFTDKGFWRVRLKRWGGPPDAPAQRAEFLAALQRCLERLPPRAAQAFVLREMEDLSSQEVCEILGLSATQLWTTMYRSRMALRECLEKNWFRRGDS